MDNLASKLCEHAALPLSNEQLLDHLRRDFPNATIGEIAHGAFRAVVETGSAGVDQAHRLYEFALSVRRGVHIV